MSARRAIPIMAAILLTALAGAQEGDRRLVGYWPFEETEGMGVTDASGNEHNGAILDDGRGVRRVPGRSGGGLEFAGGDPQARNEAGAVALPGVGELDWSKGLTIELWAKLTKLERPMTYELVSNARDDRGPGFRLMISWLSLALRTGEGGDGQTWGAGSEPSLHPIPTGEWVHFAGTYDGSVFRVYLDGVLAGESDPGLTLPAGEGTIHLGSYRGGYAYGLNAVVDDLRLYNYARSPAEIMLDARLAN